MNSFLEDAECEIKSPYGPAKALARRFEALDIDPYASKKSRYLVPLDDSGEIIEIGKPLKSSRIFGPTAIRKNVPVIKDFSQYADEIGLKNCYFWTIKLTGAKASSADLSAALEGFNTRINIVFSDLRKQLGFEPLLIAIHPHYDEYSDLFDLHAHFICRVPPANLDDVTIELATKFSIVHLKRWKIQNPEAVSTYMLWGIWRNKDMLAWPDHALRTAWDIAKARFRFMRTGGSFQKYRAGAAADKTAEKEARNSAISKEVIAANRQATIAPRMQRYETGDRVLTRVTIKRDGQRVAALLYENSEISNKKAAEPQKQEEQAAGDRYSAASNAATQEVKDKARCSRSIVPEEKSKVKFSKINWVGRCLRAALDGTKIAIRRALTAVCKKWRET